MKIFRAQKRKETYIKYLFLISLISACLSCYSQSLPDATEVESNAAGKKFETTRGSQFELCRDIEKYRNKHYPETSMCVIKKDPEFPKIATPEYKLVESGLYRQAILENMLYRVPEYKKSKVKEFNSEILDRSELQVWEFVMDVDFDGDKEEFIGYGVDGCSAGSESIKVKDGHYSDEWKRGISGLPFIYDGRPYFIKNSTLITVVLETSNKNLTDLTSRHFLHGEVASLQVCVLKLVGGL